MNISLRILFFSLLITLISCNPNKLTRENTAPSNRTYANKKPTRTEVKKPAKTASSKASSKAAVAKKDRVLQEKYAAKLEVSQNDISNMKLYSFVDEWLGVKYRYGGNTKSGVDCSGFSNALYKEVYGKQLKRTTKENFAICKKLSQSQLKEGDLVFFDINGRKNTHMGVYLRNGRFVHSSTSRGVVISKLSNPYYKKYFSKGGRI